MNLPSGYTPVCSNIMGLVYHIIIAAKIIFYCGVGWVLRKIIGSPTFKIGIPSPLFSESSRALFLPGIPDNTGCKISLGIIAK